MSVLINLPSELFASIVVNALEIEDLAALDTACTNHVLRSTFLMELSQLPMTDSFPLYEDDDPEFDCYKWLSIRNIRTHRIVLSDEVFMNKKLAIDWDMSLIVTLSIVGSHNSHYGSFVKIANSCTALKCLKCVRFPFTSINKNIMENLTKVDVGYSSPEDIEKDLKYIAKVCHNLKSLVIGSISSERFLAIAKSNPLLYHVACAGDMTVFECIVDSCPAINDIEFCTEGFGLSHFTKKIEQNPEANILLSFFYRVCYSSKSGRSLEIEEYPEEDVAALLDATKDLTSFIVTKNTASIVNDDMVASLVRNSCQTLRVFECQAEDVSSAMLRRVFLECPLLEDVKLILLADDFETAFQDLPVVPRLKVLHLEHFRMKLSTVLSALNCFRCLESCSFAIINFEGTNRDGLDELQMQLMNYYYGQPKVIECVVSYQQDQSLKVMKFDGLFFKLMSKAQLSDIAESMMMF